MKDVEINRHMFSKECNLMEGTSSLQKAKYIPKRSKCTKTLVHAAATIPYFGIKIRFNIKLTIKEMPTVVTRFTCLLEIVSTFPNNEDVVRITTTMDKGKINISAGRYSRLYSNMRSCLSNVVKNKKSEQPIINRYRNILDNKSETFSLL
jgi:hypothetical protein|tara:strand:- start:8501 stop:8950 length:450 start_codon:yes stop_codon:yes gene_type:complete